MEQAISAFIARVQPDAPPCTGDELCALARAVYTQPRTASTPPHVVTTIHFARCMLSLPPVAHMSATAEQPALPQQHVNIKKAHSVIRLVTDFFVHLNATLDEMALARVATFTPHCTEQIKLHMILFHQATTATLRHTCTPACEKHHAALIHHLTLIHTFASFLLCNIY